MMQYNRPSYGFGGQPPMYGGPFMKQGIAPRQDDQFGGMNRMPVNPWMGVQPPMFQFPQPPINPWAGMQPPRMPMSPFRSQPNPLPFLQYLLMNRGF